MVSIIYSGVIQFEFMLGAYVWLLISKRIHQLMIQKNSGWKRMLTFTYRFVIDCEIIDLINHCAFVTELMDYLEFLYFGKGNVS